MQNNSSSPEQSNSPSKWYAYNITKRNPDLKLQHAHDLSAAKISHSCREIISPYLEVLHSMFEKDKIPASYIINIDETPTFLESSKEGVLLDANSPIKPFKVTLPRKRNMTLTFAIAMNGVALPSQLICRNDSELSDFRDLEKHNIRLYQTSNGWQDETTFRDYVKVALSPVLSWRRMDDRETTPVILLVDSHYSHLGLDCLKWCAQNNITVIRPPSETSHLVQPLDCGVNAVFKTKFRSALEDRYFQFVLYFTLPFSPIFS